MIRAFRYPLHPTKAQESVLESWLASCCELYNAALQERRDAWRRQRVSVQYLDQQKALTEIRSAFPEWQAVPVWIARSALRRLDLAFQSFFRRCKSGETPGYPRFRSRDRYDNFDLGSEVPRIDGNRVCLPKLGLVKFHKYREMRGQILRVSVSRTARGWTVSFVCDLGATPEKRAVTSAVGIDVGLEAFATLSTGERVENPRFFRASEEVLARRQRALSKKCLGSRSRLRARRLVARVHERVRNQRLDFARKLACALFSRFDLVAYEDLAIARMVRGDLAKSIHDAAWRVFLDAVKIKAEGAGAWALPVDPSGTSQRCASCGAIVKKTLGERQHACPSCDFATHRDHNAALNVLALGLSAVQLT